MTRKAIRGRASRIVLLFQLTIHKIKGCPALFTFITNQPYSFPQVLNAIGIIVIQFPIGIKHNTLLTTKFLCHFRKASAFIMTFRAC
ncbi:MAG: hypothetical protein IMZ43_12285 [Thermoplasmata archaeon]|nr:hypothetical protein [Thermoplasmata archaeon]